MKVNYKPFLTLIFVAAAGMMQWILWPVVHPYTWFFLLPAVFLSAWFDGLRGAVISTLMTALTGVLFFLPAGSPEIPHYIHIAFFLLFGLIIGIAARYVKNLEQKLKKNYEELLSSTANLRKSELKLKYHLENSPIAVIEWDRDYIVRQWSRQAEHLFGWSAAETIGKPIGDLKMVYEEDLPVLDKTMTRLTGGNELTVFSTNRNYTKDGRIITCNWYNSVLVDNEGKMESVMSLVEDITEVSEGMKQLEESEKQYRELVHNAPAGIYEVDFKTQKLVRVNRAMVILTGYSEEELLSMKVSDLFHEDSSKQFLERAERLMKGDVLSESIVYKIVRKDGQIMFALVNVKFRSGSTIGSGIGYDITERINIETKLRESEERLRFALKTSNIGAWTLNLQDHTSIRSIEHDRIFGFDSLLPEWTYEMFLEHVIDEDRRIVDQKFRQSVKNQTDWNFECRIKRQDGQIRWIWAAGRQYTGTDNLPYLAGVVQDITATKQIEEDLRKAQRKLNIALDNASVGIWEWNPATDELLFDERAEKMFGIKPGRFERTYRNFENLIDEEDILHLRKAISTALGKNVPFETILRIRRRSKITRYINLKGIVSINKLKNEKWISGVCFDITNLKQGTEKLIMKLNEDLLRSNNDLQQFAYVASHDLQEPLRMISSFTQLLQQRYNDRLDSDANDYIRYAVEGSKRMYELLNGLLAYSRINTRGREFTWVDMNRVLGIVKDNLSLRINEREAIVESDLLPVISADESQMIQLMQNLIENGMKFSINAPRINISSELKGDYYIFSVSDEGIGIERQYFERIFKIFQKLHRPELYSGTGIGLAICKRIVYRHGGEIWLKSETGKGSVFFFTIPYKKYHEDAAGDKVLEAHTITGLF